MHKSFTRNKSIYRKELKLLLFASKDMNKQKELCIKVLQEIKACTENN